MTDQEEFNEIMSAHDNAMCEYYEACERNNEPILAAIKEEKREDWYSDFQEYMNDSEVHGMFKIVTKPKGKKQAEYGLIEFVWVDQHSEGDSGDSFYGTVTVEIGENKYLEMPFSM